MRDQPPQNQKDFGLGDFGAPLSDEHENTLTAEEAGALAREAYMSSTNWLNASRRKEWGNSLRAFNSEHMSGSKYLSSDYRHRSNLYRPKSRAMVRKAEAQTAAAFFSNSDVVSIKPQNEDDPQQEAGADTMSALLQYRLTETIPWFMTLVGARQDTEVMGVCIAKAEWLYEEAVTGSTTRLKVDDKGEPMLGDDKVPLIEEMDVIESTIDQPSVSLIAPENFRFDPGADWRDPIGTSPYLIELVPMYHQDIVAKMESGEWMHVDGAALAASGDLTNDTTRRIREQGRVPGKDNDASTPPQPFIICWVHLNIIRWGGKDWQFWSLGETATLLTKPRPLTEVFLHGRPYVLGQVVVETHRTYPSSKVELIRDLQRATNDDWNLRFDNVKLALNPRQVVKAGSGIELDDLRTWAPGKIIMMRNPKEDVVWDRPPSPDQSAYMEQDRINLDIDEMTGDFSNSSVQSNQLQQQSATGMNLMSGQASGMNEYELRLFAMTFVEPILRMLVKLEQTYETDETILALAGAKAKIQRFGLTKVSDEMLNSGMTVQVNVGIGATNPNLKLKNLVTGTEILAKVFGPAAAQGVNFDEFCKELFGILGYKDGARFFVPGFNPAQAMQQMAAAKGGGKAGPSGPNPQELAAKQQLAQTDAEAQLQKAQIESQTDLQLAQMENQRAAQQAQNEQEQLMAELQAHQQVEASRQQHSMNLEHFRQMTQMHPALQGMAGGSPRPQEPNISRRR